MTALNRWLDQDLRRAALTAAAALLALCGLAFFLELGGLGLMDKTEGLFVEVPRQMLLRGDWVTPRWNGTTFFDYPVWGYWMVALSFRLFGISEWAARLRPPALRSWLSLVWCWRWHRLQSGPVGALGAPASAL
ncbi:MAG: ArnT family glycosyltransferase [Vulcanococcus sp.]